MNRDLLDRAIRSAEDDGRALLLETEGLQVLAALGIATPRHLVVEDPGDITEDRLAELAGGRVVIKAVVPGVTHKTDLGGVAFVDRKPDRVRSVANELFERFRERDVRALVIYEEVAVDRSLGGELLLSLEWNREFGPVLHLGPGGLDAELLAERLAPDRAMAALSPRLPVASGGTHDLRRIAAVEALTRSRRGLPAMATRADLDELLAGLCACAEELLTEYLDELEINPLVPSGKGFLALDVVARRRSGDRCGRAARPLAKIARLLEPRSIGLVGVSRRLNPGRLILRNILREGFDPARIRVIKEGPDELDGCRCVPELEALPGPVDLLIVSLAAAEVPELVTRVVAGRHAESLIVIPGGLDEKSGGDTLAKRIREALDASRRTDWGGPIVNGGNCLGIRSRPGRYDTLFLPVHKLAAPDPERPANAALISQSGAFLAARMSKLADVGWKYAISVGNQLDLTLGDYLEYLADDPELRLFAVYAEGFTAGDGLRCLEAAIRIRRRGGRVILYRAGRSRAGVEAAASHTAAMAGDYAVTRALAMAAGVQLAETLEDFEDLVELHDRLDPEPGKIVERASRSARTPRLGAMSNAGFECVAMGDNLRGFEAARFSEATRRRLAEIFERCRIDRVVDVRNPLDLTPMAGDEAFVDAAEAMLEDPAVDAAIVGCVPLTGALATLPAGPGHTEDLDAEGSVVARLVRLRRKQDKPWVAVVDAGPAYDEMARRLRAGGVPTFRRVDRALDVFERYCRARFGPESRAELPDGPVLDSPVSD